MDDSSRPGMIERFALVGPGRAGTSLSLALASRGARAVAVAGRTPAAESTRRVAALLDAPAVAVEDAGPNADLVIIATPDAEIAHTAERLAPCLRPGALVVHVAGALTLHELDEIARARPDVEIGSLHPLQALPSGEVGRKRLAGSWCAVDGPTRVDRLALTLGMRPFRLDPAARARYHATAVHASNHLVALLGQIERLAAEVGVPAEAFLPLVRSTVENVGDLGARRALTGPVARGDVATVAAHLETLPASERETYRALAAAALRLTGRDDEELATLLFDSELVQ